MQLRVTEHKLNLHGDIHARYVDVSEHQDLSKLQPGCLFALAGLTLIENAHIPFPDPMEAQYFAHFAKGYIEEYPDHDDYVPDGYVPGAVTPPTPEWPDIPQVSVDRLRSLHSYYQSQGRTFVVLLDSLDRAISREAVSTLIAQDVPALKFCEIGLVFVAPMRSLEGFGWLDVERFEKLHYQGPIDIAIPSGRQFLSEVLQRRTDPDMLPDEAIQEIVLLSGGVLRDLISLAKAAGDEAYLRGADRIGREHVSAAADSFGRALMIGLSSAELSTLESLRLGKGFIHTSDADLALLLTRRVLEYRTGPTPRYAVHPTIAILLKQRAGDR